MAARRRSGTEYTSKRRPARVASAQRTAATRTGTSRQRDEQDRLIVLRLAAVCEDLHVIDEVRKEMFGVAIGCASEAPHQPFESEHFTGARLPLGDPVRVEDE